MRVTIDKILIAAAIAISIALAGGCRSGRKAPVEAEALQDTIYPLGFCTDSFDVIEGTLRSGETFSGLMTRLGMSLDSANMLAAVSDSTFDPTSMRAGNQWRAYFQADTTGIGALQYLVYDRNKVDMTVFRCSGELASWPVRRPVTVTPRYADVTITSSLWNDMQKAGVPILLISDLSEIYAWTIDFFRLADGDRFRVLYDEESVDGEAIDVDPIYYAVYERDTLRIPAIMLDQGDGGNIYWKPGGESLRKAFLKAPLKFTRISSGFSYHRLHPVYGTVRAHTGVDYAASTGTPVMSIGDGTVIGRGWAGGGGNTVKIRHNSVYTTSYMHLSRYAYGLKVGDRVSQGDVIGYVGMTGTATGPHLDFRVWKNGTPIDPLHMDAPSADPIRPENLHALDSVWHVYSARIDSLARADSLAALVDTLVSPMKLEALEN